MAKAGIRKEPLWITKLKLWMRSFRQNLELFKERKIAIFGLSVIIFFAIFGAIHPLYLKVMEKLYINKTYDVSKQIYARYQEKLLPDLEAAIQSGNEIVYKLKKSTLSSQILYDVKENIFKKHSMALENEFMDNLQRLLEDKYYDFQTRKGMFASLDRVFQDYQIISEENLEDLNKEITSYFFMEKVENFITEFGGEEKSSIAWNFIDENTLRNSLKEIANISPDYLSEIANSYGLPYTSKEIKANLDRFVDELMSFAKFNVFPLLEYAYDAINIGKVRGVLEKDNEVFLAYAGKSSEILEAYLGKVPSQEEMVKDKEKVIQILLENMDLDSFTGAYLAVKIMRMFSEGKEKLKAYLQEMMKKHIKWELINDLRFDKVRKIEAYGNTMAYYNEAFFQIFGISNVLLQLEEALKKNDMKKANEYALLLAAKLKNLAEIRRTAAIISNWVENLKGGYGGEGKIGLDFRQIDPQIASYLKNSADSFFEELSTMAREMTDFLNMLDERYLYQLYKDGLSVVQDLKEGKTPDLSVLKEELTKKFKGKSVFDEDSKIYGRLVSMRRVLEDLAKKVVIYEVYYLADFFQKKLMESLGEVETTKELQEAAEKYRAVIKGRETIELESELNSFAETARRAQLQIIGIPLKDVNLPKYNIALVEGIIGAHRVFQEGVQRVLREYIGKKVGKEIYDKLLDISAYYDMKELCKSFFYSSLPYDPITGNDGLYSNPAPPSILHPLGTDPLGRDIMSEMMYSTPREFVLGVTAALITVIIGTLIGATAAYFGGVIDTFFMRVADIVMLFPSLALLMVLSAFMELTLFRLALIMGIISGFGSITIVLKAQALTVKVRPFIEAAKSAGGSDFYIIAKHIIPNILPLSFLYMMFSVTSAIFSEAVLSFFGLVQLRMSWGIILHTAQSQGYLIGTNIGTFWWLWVPPGAAITLICSAFYFLGRGLEEIVNPRLRSR